ncbi:MAG: hypothetical protein ACE5IH_03920 [Thermodesulfobacteriota bacterium]
MTPGKSKKNFKVYTAKKFIAELNFKQSWVEERNPTITTADILMGALPI